MKRREFLQLGLAASVGVVAAKTLQSDTAWAADPKKLADKDVMKDGQPATISNYCSNPAKNTKTCPDYKTKPGNCETCTFFNVDNSLTDYKGGKVARCQLLTDPSKAQFVSAKGWCSTYNKKPA
jgi:hypothetical protein